MILLLGFFALSIIFSFLCSIWEAVLLSIPASYVQIKKKEGGALGKTLVEFKENVDQPLAAILTLNTIAHTVGAIGVGAAATSLWGETNPFITGAVVPVVMTLAILILSEIIPKTLGANGWEGLAPFTVKSLRIVIWCLWPLVWLAQLITKFMKKDKKKSVLSRVRAEDIMTPRTVVTSSPEETSIQEFYDAHRGKLRFSRIPLFQKGNRDDVNSFFLKGDMLDKIIQGNGEDSLKSIARPISIMNEKILLPDLFNSMMEKREHIALVVDEFGGMSGIVTMEDVIETLLGTEIVDEMDGDTDMQALARKNWEKRAKGLGLIDGERK